MSAKLVTNTRQAVEGIEDGMTVLIGGFGDVGLPSALIDALVDLGPKDLTIVANNAGTGRSGIAKILAAGAVRKIVCSYPRQRGSDVFDALYVAGEIELELVPQGTLAERIRAGGAGILGFYTSTAIGTPLAEGREVRQFGTTQGVFELPIQADVALVRAYKGDSGGNLVYQATARNYNPIMCTAANLTIAEVDYCVPTGSLEPEAVVTPGIFVDRLVITETHTDAERY